MRVFRPAGSLRTPSERSYSRRAPGPVPRGRGSDEAKHSVRGGALSRRRSRRLGGGPRAAAQDLERGEELFQLCAQCHGDAGRGQRALRSRPRSRACRVWYLEGQLDKFRDGGRGTHFDDIAGHAHAPDGAVAAHRRGDDLRTSPPTSRRCPRRSRPPTLDGRRRRARRRRSTRSAGLPRRRRRGQRRRSTARRSPTRATGTCSRQLQHFKAGVRGIEPGDATARDARHGRRPRRRAGHEGRDRLHRRRLEAGEVGSEPTMAKEYSRRRARDAGLPASRWRASRPSIVAVFLFVILADRGATT